MSFLPQKLLYFLNFLLAELLPVAEGGDEARQGHLEFLLHQLPLLGLLLGDDGGNTAFSLRSTSRPARRLIAV